MEQTPVLYVNGCACKWVRAGCAGGALRAGGAEMINWGSPRGCFLLCYLCLARSRQEGRRAQKGEVVAGTDSRGKERGNYNPVKRRCLGGFISWNCGKAAWECCGNVLECCGFLCCRMRNVSLLSMERRSSIHSTVQLSFCKLMIGAVLFIVMVKIPGFSRRTCVTLVF